jgi:hypothetical protein
MTVKAKPRELPRRSYHIDLTGELDGYHVVMGAMWGRELIRLRRGEMDEADVLELIAERCLEHDFAVEDLRDLDFWMLLAILDGWKEAQMDAALPPTNGTGSPAVSGSSRSTRTGR